MGGGQNPIESTDTAQDWDLVRGKGHYFKFENRQDPPHFLKKCSVYINFEISLMLERVFTPVSVRRKRFARSTCSLVTFDEHIIRQFKTSPCRFKSETTKLCVLFGISLSIWYVLTETSTAWPRWVTGTTVDFLERCKLFHAFLTAQAFWQKKSNVEIHVHWSLAHFDYFLWVYIRVLENVAFLFCNFLVHEKISNLNKIQCGLNGRAWNGRIFYKQLWTDNKVIFLSWALRDAGIVHCLTQQ